MPQRSAQFIHIRKGFSKTYCGLKTQRSISVDVAKIVTVFEWEIVLKGCNKCMSMFAVSLDKEMKRGHKTDATVTPNPPARRNAKGKRCVEPASSQL